MSGQGDLSKLTEFLNTTVRRACMFLPRVHTVPQGRLTSSGKQLESRYQTDGLHLTEAGAALLTKNIIETGSKVIPDLATPGQANLSKAAGTRGSHDSRQPSRGGHKGPEREEPGCEAGSWLQEGAQGAREGWALGLKIPASRVQ